MKRVYSSDGKKSAPLAVFLILSFFILPILIIGSFMFELFSGLKFAFRQARYAAKDEWDSFVRLWREAR